jgi:hypothetical protein
MRNALRGRGQQLLAAFLMGLILALILGVEAVRAQSPEEPAGSLPAPGRETMVGYDISWPQCGVAYPAEPVAFGIVGVTGGKPYTVNRCLASQWQWADRAGYPGEVYINLDYWRRTSYTHFFGPAGLCSPLDAYCQGYNYGWNAAREAVAYGQAQGVDAVRWWLDVETMNHWSHDTAANARIIEGAIDYLEGEALEVGIYSTPYQWGVIAGGYAPGLPVWTAGARNVFDAAARCGNPRYAFGGGEIELVQWVETYDMNYACP